MIDALEQLPAPFRERLGWVAIVIEDEATAGPARIGRGARPVRPVPGRAADRLRRRRGRRPQQDHDVPRAAPTRLPLAGRPGCGGRDTVYHEIAHHFGISDARLHELRHGGPCGEPVAVQG